MFVHRHLINLFDKHAYEILRILVVQALKIKPWQGLIPDGDHIAYLGQPVQPIDDIRIPVTL